LRLAGLRRAAVDRDAVVREAVDRDAVVRVDRDAALRGVAFDAVRRLDVALLVRRADGMSDDIPVEPDVDFDRLPVPRDAPRVTGPPRGGIPQQQGGGARG